MQRLRGISLICIFFSPEHYHEITITDPCAVIVLVGEGRDWARAPRPTVIFSFMMHIYYLSLKLNAQQAVNSTECRIRGPRDEG